MAGEQALLEELARLKKENESLRRQMGAAADVKTAPAPKAAAKIETLDNRQIERFSRQLLLKEIGVKGSYRLVVEGWVSNLTSLWTRPQDKLHFRMPRYSSSELEVLDRRQHSTLLLLVLVGFSRLEVRERGRLTRTKRDRNPRNRRTRHDRC
jgi:hypothetical protein